MLLLYYEHFTMFLYCPERKGKGKLYLHTKLQKVNISILKERKKEIYDKLTCVATCECPGKAILEAQMKHSNTRDWSLKPPQH